MLSIFPYHVCYFRYQVLTLFHVNFKKKSQLGCFVFVFALFFKAVNLSGFKCLNFCAIFLFFSPY